MDMRRLIDSGKHINTLESIFELGVDIMETSKALEELKKKIGLLHKWWRRQKVDEHVRKAVDLLFMFNQSYLRLMRDLSLEYERKKEEEELIPWEELEEEEEIPEEELW